MRIGLDIRKAFDEYGGMSVVAYQFTTYFIDLLNKNGYEYTIFPHRLREWKSMQFIEPFIQELIWKQAILPFEILIRDINVMIYTYPLVPLVATKPSIIFIYDMQYWEEPSERSFTNRFVLSMVKFSALRSNKIITISQFVKKSIIKYLRINSEKIVVAYPGYEHVILNGNTHSHIPHNKYILTVLGTFAKRKNAISLLKAYSLLPNDIRSTYKLVIVASKKGPEWPHVQETILNLGLNKNIVITGHISKEELISLYRHAEMLVHPVVYEGFGLPVLEAMAIGTPVIAGNKTSIPEVAGDAALLVDPNDARELSIAILKLIQDDSLREELREKGIVRSRKFSWKRMAETVLRALKEVMEN